MHLREQIIFKSTYILTAVPWSPLYVGLTFQLNIIMQPQPNYQRGLLGSGLLGRRHQKLKTEFNSTELAGRQRSETTMARSLRESLYMVDGLIK